MSVIGKRMLSKKRRLSMKMKLVGILSPVIVVILAILVVFSYNISKDIIEQRSAQLLDSSISGQATSITAWLNENLAAFHNPK